MPLDDACRIAPPHDADSALERRLARANDHHRSLGQALALLAVAALAFAVAPAQRPAPTTPPVAALGPIGGGDAN